ncbi:MAG TPA: histidine kinase dimerization/phospho-acceptor domain-containing protein [Alphaproteobacteria bacterium]|nr:histidine kinase dimerization/phospho-acceptor domain-containing protein [Alphaproteobacteria bacterium]
MTNALYLTETITSLIALGLVIFISATVLFLLPRRNCGDQLFWIVPCISIAASEAFRHTVEVTLLVDGLLKSAVIFIVSVMLSSRIRSTSARPAAVPAMIMVCGTFAAVPAILAAAGVGGPIYLAATVGCLLAASCWPMCDRQMEMPSARRRDEIFLILLVLGYTLWVISDVPSPEREDVSPLSEVFEHYAGVLIGFATGSVVLGHAIRENQHLAEREHTARVAQEEASQFLRALIDANPAAVYVKDLAGRYQLVNPVVMKWVNAPGVALIGKKAEDVFPRETAESMRQHDLMVIESGEQINREVLIPHENGGMRSLIDYKFPLFDADGKVNAVAGLAVDITQIKEYENELIMARFKAEEANRAKSNFLAHMSHELRTPLNAIIGFSDVIQRGMFGPDNMPLYQQYAGDIHRAGNLLLAQVNDLLDISRVEAGTFDLALKSVALNTIAEECCHLLRDQAERRRVTLSIDPARPLPQVTCDPRATLQVLINLAGNAIKYVPEGSTITIAGGRTESGVDYFLVEDNGPGLPSRVLQALLDPWTHQSAVVTENGQGGMGLLLSRKLMEVQGGRLVIESSPGKGTRIACQFGGASRESQQAARSKGA